MLYIYIYILSDSIVYLYIHIRSYLLLIFKMERKRGSEEMGKRRVESNKSTLSLSVEEAFEYSGGFGLYQIIRLIISGMIYTGHMVFLFSLPFFERESIKCLGGEYKEMEHCPPEAPCYNRQIKYNYLDTEQSTIIAEFDLICERSFIGWIGTSYFIGYICISYFVAVLSESYGRKVVIMGELAVCVVGSLVFVLATPGNIWLLILGSWLLGLGTGYIGPGGNLAFDTVRSTNISTAIIYINIIYALMEILIGAMMYVDYAWKTHMQITILWYILWGVALLFMTDGPRYYIFRGKYKEAMEQFRSIAYWNGQGSVFPCGEGVELVVSGGGHAHTHTQTHAHIYAHKTSETPTQHSFWEIFKHKSTREAFLLICPVIIANILVFYGIVMDMPRMGGSMQLNTIMAGVFEIVADIVSIYMAQMPAFGRKYTQFIFLLLAGSGFGLEILFGGYFGESTLFIVVVIVIRKFGISGSFNILGIFLGELFPSEVRSSVMGATVIIGSLGCLIAPMIVQISSYTTLIFATICFIAAYFSLHFTETRGKIVPDMFLNSDLEDESREPFLKSRNNNEY